VLLLAGTGEAAALARLLADEPGVEVLSSLAGHTPAPHDWSGPLRTGGFGGVEGLVETLLAGQFDALVDATHPFSATMPANAEQAARTAGVAHLRLLRPAWAPGPGDRWDEVADIDTAVQHLQALDCRCALITIGRLELGAFRSVRGRRLVVRSISPPDPATLPAGTVLVAARGPFSEDDEVRLLRTHGVDVVVTKNSGGDDAKLRAARRVGATVIMVRRPWTGPAGATTAQAARSWLLGRTACGQDR
jgi:precorrin-6A/cobalt-precorrin-6A reductase